MKTEADTNKPIVKTTECVVKKTIIYKGEELKPDSKVNLTARRAEVLKSTGHIV